MRDFDRDTIMFKAADNPAMAAVRGHLASLVTGVEASEPATIDDVGPGMAMLIQCIVAVAVIASILWAFLS